MIAVGNSQWWHAKDSTIFKKQMHCDKPVIATILSHLKNGYAKKRP